MITIAPIKMVMTGGWFIIVLPTLLVFISYPKWEPTTFIHLKGSCLAGIQCEYNPGHSWWVSHCRRQTPSIFFASCRNIHFQPRRNDKHGQTMFEGFLPKFLMIIIEYILYIYIYIHIIPGFPVRFQGLIDCYSHSIIRLWVDTCKEFPAAAYDSCPWGWLTSDSLQLLAGE